MRLPQTPLALATALLVALPAAASATVGSPASVVVAVVNPLTAAAQWSPVEGADEYRVYGSDGASLTLLAQTPDLYALVQTGFATYAVSAVVDGTEGAPTFVTNGPCVTPDLGPPPRIDFDQCSAAFGIGVKVGLL